MIVYEVFQRVVELFGEDDRRGTAFLIGTGDDQLLVTARHLCGDLAQETVRIRHSNTNDGFAFPTTITRVAVGEGASADFAVYRLPIALEVLSDVPLSHHGLTYGQNCVILGYPYGLSFQPDGNGQQRLPFAKKCIMSAAESDEDGVGKLYVDTIVNPGFSGGPLAFNVQGSRKWQFAGVVVQNIMAPMWEQKPDEPEPPKGHARIGLVVDARTISRAIEKQRWNA